MADIRLEQGLVEREIPLGLPELPEVFFEAVRRRFHLDGGGRMLALWCGAGAFLSLAENFESVLIVDPEPGRLAESVHEAEKLNVENAIFLEGEREVLHPRMGRFRLVIVQDCFLRKARKRSLSFLAKMTEPEGGVVIANVHRCGSLTKWQKAALEVLRDRFGGRLHEGGLTSSATWDGQSLPFRNTEIYRHRWTQKRTVGQAVTDILSAWCPFFRKRAALEEMLRDALWKAEPSGVLEERLRLTAVFAWIGKPPSASFCSAGGC